MKALAVLLLGLGAWAALTAPFAAGVADGRAGLRALAAADTAAADTAFAAGLAADGAPRWVQARLLYNLGRLRLASDPAAADSLSAAAVAAADDPALRARAAYHAGLGALGADDAARAVTHLRRSLLLQPDAPDAQRAYEIARRRADASGAPTPEAEALKAQAERLVAARRYADALALLESNRARVPSLAAYDEWTGRLSGVVQIERDVAAADTSAAAPAVPSP